MDQSKLKQGVVVGDTDLDKAQIVKEKVKIVDLSIITWAPFNMNV